MLSLPKNFQNGDKIEVLRTGDVGSPATVLHSSSEKREGKMMLHVEYESKELTEFVDVQNVRPQRPPELPECFLVGNAVEVNMEKGWRRGHVKEILENSKYLVSLGRSFDDGGDNVGVVEVEQWRLRVPRDWRNGVWVPPLIQTENNEKQKESSQLEIGPKKQKLRIKQSPRFREGTTVEVKSDEEGYRGSWYSAAIVKYLGNDKFLVEYQTLRTDDETELLKEEVDGSFIRLPPPWKVVDRFDCFEQVDAWYNDGWWEGRISQVLEKLQYVVYFENTNEEMVFEHCKLRLHQEWIGHKWVTASKPKRKSARSKGKDPRAKMKCWKLLPQFSISTVVEVRSDEEGYQGSWYTAVIVDSLGNNKFLVEYQTLTTDDGSKHYKDETCASYIRPLPPKIQRIDRFKILEEVDAWYNDGWWVGLVIRFLPGVKYVIYFWTTNEEMEFGHFKLRPHQEWINGEWIASFLTRYKLPTKSRISKSKMHYTDITSIASLVSGAKVEVASEEGGILASWYPAIIIGPKKDGKYMVEYRTLKTDHSLELLKEEVDAASVRPSPPILQQKDQFKPDDNIDVWYKNGWWIGQVCQVLEGPKYEVYFSATKEILEFQHASVRLHQDWVDEKWNIATWG